MAQQEVAMENTLMVRMSVINWTIMENILMVREFFSPTF